MFLTESKLRSRLHELSDYRYRDRMPIPFFHSLEDARKEINPEIPSSADYTGTLKIGESWSGRDLYLWLYAEMNIPAEWSGRRILGRFDLGETGGGNNSGFESLFYLHGQPYQGVDSNHLEVFFNEDPAGTTLPLTLRLWSGLEGGGVQQNQTHGIRIAEVCWLDEPADDYYHTLLAVSETVEVLDPNLPERSQLLKAADRSLLLIDWSSPGSDAFYESLREARDSLSNAIDRMDKHSAVEITAIGHTHIDVAWLWRLKHTREKTARSFSTVMRLMELFPEYTFLQTQPQLYDYVKTDYPELYEDIKARAAEGRWEASGAMWLEADCNLTSGESLVRQILVGTKFYREEFGAECDYLWLPDVFGYSWALPQILKKSGIHTFMTTKISWNQYNRMPHDTFMWRGMDGTEILTHFITTTEPWSEPGSWFYTYNGNIMPKTVKGSWDAYRDKEMNQKLLFSYGYGDGGGGVNRNMLEMRRRIDRMPGLPKMKTGTAGDYFRKLRETVEKTDSYVHTWDGELYLEYHRGTYTSQAYNKRMNRKLELLYRESEWLNALNAVLSGDWNQYAKKELDEGWKIILRNQFHDIIPGSSIREVYEDSTIEYAEAEQLGLKARSGAEQGLLTGSADGSSSQAVRRFTVWNSSPWAETGIVEISAAGSAVNETDSIANAGGVWKNHLGETLRAQLSDGVWLVEATDVPSLGYAELTFEPGGAADHADLPADTGLSGAAVAQAAAQRSDSEINEANKVNEASEASKANDSHPASLIENPVSSHSVFTLRENGVDTPFYELDWNEQGQLTRIYDRRADREVLAHGQRGNVFQLFEDKPLAHEAWDVDIFYQQKSWELDNLTSVSVKENGILRCVIAFVWETAASRIEQQMIVYASDRRIDFKTKADWHERRVLLKAAFPVHVRATEATYDVQYGNVKRPTHWNTSWDMARFETVGHQWADLSDKGYGVSLLNDCKYGYDIKDHVMRLSLIKCAQHPDTEADQGAHEFTYSLLPHEGDWLLGGTVRSAWALNNPFRVSEGAPERSALSMFRLSVSTGVGTAWRHSGVIAEHTNAANFSTERMQAAGGEQHGGAERSRAVVGVFGGAVGAFDAAKNLTAMISAVKRSEDGEFVVLRVHDFSGSRQKLTLESDLSIASWQACNLMEQPEGERWQEPQIDFVLEPYEIRTFLIDLRA
ncbi:alpha-mannosidase [Saccharibacillus kuerlensis]|uniref:Alpha-mannosidase n=1 Tax=Saccharibacillus kuerlensis TaxID=459527 RepID=A0ABQ2L2Q4_9BACL|nr:alpha-mannosidase [Saccharibacillus kuerlensis]GGO00588.1 alpha-mannosidase [Saccharibacillus kuerlensis]